VILHKRVILTKGNLIIKYGNARKLEMLIFNDDELIEHLFFLLFFAIVLSSFAELYLLHLV
jgi:hypothetical protein